MRCPSREHDNRADRRFCAECGGGLAAVCASCGAANQPGDKHCGGCGAALTTGRATAPPRAPATYTPKHLAEKIFTSRSALAGERKQVTVLCADVKGSMELAEQMDPEAWSAIMQRFFTILADGIERFEGFVDKFSGDGIMALFGAPIAPEDHAQRACSAALHRRDRLRDFGTEVKRRSGVDFAVRIGIEERDDERVARERIAGRSSRGDAGFMRRAATTGRSRAWSPHTGRSGRTAADSGSISLMPAERPRSPDGRTILWHVPASGSSSTGRQRSPAASARHWPPPQKPSSSARRAPSGK